MTIAALQRLLQEEQPDVVRHPAPRLNRRRPRPSQDPAMDIPTARPQPAAIELPDKHLAELLLWAAQHDDPAVVTHGDQARAAVNALTERRRHDVELSLVIDEAAELEQRLTELRARQAELQPAPTRGKARRDYDPATVRAWARANGHTVPDRGQIPKTAMAAWRARSAGEA